MKGIGEYTIEDGIGIISVNHPPMNALGIEVRRALDEGLCLFAHDDNVRAIVLMGAGGTFFGGGAVREFGRPVQQPTARQIFDDIEQIQKPMIAAMNGRALGGGFELALACDWRIAAPSTRMGLPHVRLGLCPGGGGTQRLTRIVGAEMALDLLLSGRTIQAPEALELEILDALASEDDLRADAIAFARNVLAENRPVIRVRDRHEKIYEARGKWNLFEAYRAENAELWRGRKAPQAIVTAIEAAVAMPFDQGMEVEASLFREMWTSAESAATRHVFFAGYATTHIPDIPADTPTLPIRKVGVVGTGRMGNAIAINFLNAGIPVTFVGRSEESLEQGVERLRTNYAATVNRGLMPDSQVARSLALLTPAISLEALADADLVIEAVPDRMALKQEIFARIDAVVRPDTIMATSTNFLDLDKIAATTSHPERVIGMHFFAPAHIMRLLEIVRGARSSKSVIQTAMRLALRIEKSPILARSAPGFIANRLMMPQIPAAEALALEGTPPALIDKTAFDFGFAMGPFQTLDFIGLDIAAHGNNERSLCGDLVAKGRLGPKKNGGFYDYDADYRPTPSPEAAQVITDLAAFRGITPRAPRSAGEIIPRLLYPVVNEGAKILEEGAALRAGDIDVAAVRGFHWPAHTGGPMFWADTTGLAEIVDGLKAQGIEPAPLLVRLAANDERFIQDPSYPDQG